MKKRRMKNNYKGPLTMLKQFRTYVAIARLQEQSVEETRPRISLEGINTEIATVRKKRK